MFGTSFQSAFGSGWEAIKYWKLANILTEGRIPFIYFRMFKPQQESKINEWFLTREAYCSEAKEIIPLEHTLISKLYIVKDPAPPKATARMSKSLVLLESC